MTHTYRSLLSVCAAAGIAVAGVAANSAEAYTRTIPVSPIATSAQKVIRTPVVTEFNRAPATGFDMGIGQLVKNADPGRDQLMIMSGGGDTSVSVSTVTWTCRAKLYLGGTLVKSTLVARSDKNNTGTQEGLTAYTADASGPNHSYPRVAATQLRADCSN
ncbi:MAG TPA: hypothetical protein VJU61_19330 [Polyangiaceae bacterium]|nr:hypothetical protein [Polyangiaceae bacterium]